MNPDPFTRAMFGQHAIHIGANIIVQAYEEDNKAIFVGQTSMAHPLLFGSKKAHQLILGDLILRPHLVIGSDNFVGIGLAGLARDGFLSADKWLENGEILVKNIPVEEFLKRTER
jgi:hypothetical protein